jgi:hypothetical protein
MTVDLRILRKVDSACVEFKKQMQAIPVPTVEEEGTFYHIITVLADAATENYSVLRRSFEVDDQLRMAWSCRNLLEISLIAEWVLLSKTNAVAFASDRLIDAVEIGKCLKRLAGSLKAWVDSTDQSPDVLSAATLIDYDEIIQQFTTELQRAGVKREKPKKIADVARELQRVDDYEAMNKLCSKFVHPTSWSLFTAEAGSARFPDAGELFMMCGAQYFSAVFAAILPHYRKWGLRHKAPEKWGAAFTP